jgi:hypothetical protein
MPCRTVAFYSFVQERHSPQLSGINEATCWRHRLQYVAKNISGILAYSTKQHTFPVLFISHATVPRYMNTVWATGSFVKWIRKNNKEFPVQLSAYAYRQHRGGMCVRMYVYTYVCMCASTHVRMYVCICMHVRTYVCMYVCTYVCVYVQPKA